MLKVYCCNIQRHLTKQNQSKRDTMEPKLLCVSPVNLVLERALLIHKLRDLKDGNEQEYTSCYLQESVCPSLDK